MGTRKTVGKEIEPTTPRGGTYLDLKGWLGELKGTDGENPWIRAWLYQNGSTADSMRSRINQAKIVLPDHLGGDRGVWKAKVQRVKKGTENKSGPAWVYVRYVGVQDAGT